MLAAKKFERTSEVPERKPAVPKRSEAPLHGLTSGKDFVTTNAVSAMLTAPKRLPREEPDWTAKPDYGKVPEYLDRVKKDIEAEHEYIMSLLDEKQMEEESASGVRMRELTSGEREELIDALKTKWDAVNTAYQRITFKKISTSNSTTGEIRFKEQCESSLAQIEKDIARLSVKAPIFVVDDTPVAASHSHSHHPSSSSSSSLGYGGGSAAAGGAGLGGPLSASSARGGMGGLGSAGSGAGTPGGGAGGRFSASSVMRSAAGMGATAAPTRSGAASATSSRR